MTLASFHLLRELSPSSWIITMPPAHMLCLGLVHFWCWCKIARYSFFHHAQNSFERCCTCPQSFLQYCSAWLKTPRGGRTILVFRVRKWFGVSGHSDMGSLRLSTVNGLLLAIASALHENVRRASTLSWVLFLSSRAFRTLRTGWIWCSQTPSKWLAEGVFIWKVNQSHSCCWSSFHPALQGQGSTLF